MVLTQEEMLRMPRGAERKAFSFGSVSVTQIQGPGRGLTARPELAWAEPFAQSRRAEWAGCLSAQKWKVLRCRKHRKASPKLMEDSAQLNKVGENRHPPRRLRYRLEPGERPAEEEPRGSYKPGGGEGP